MVLGMVGWVYVQSWALFIVGCVWGLGEQWAVTLLVHDAVVVFFPVIRPQVQAMIALLLEQGLVLEGQVFV